MWLENKTKDKGLFCIPKTTLFISLQQKKSQYEAWNPTTTVKITLNKLTQRESLTPVEFVMWKEEDVFGLVWFGAARSNNSSQNVETYC